MTTGSLPQALLRLRSRSPVVRYAAPVALMVLSVAVAVSVGHAELGDEILTPAVLFAAWYGGIGPGLVTVAIASLSISYFFTEPLYSLSVATEEDWAFLAVYTVSVVLVAWLTAIQQRTTDALLVARDELTARMHDLRAANADLRTEIAERERMAVEVRKQASLLDLTHDGIYVRDGGDVTTYWNRGATELYGWTSEEACGRSSHAMLRTVFPIPKSAIEAELYRTGRWEGELVQTTRDGARVIVTSRWSLQTDAEGRPVGILETNSDVTARRRADEMRDEARAALARVTRVTTLGEITASIAHEVNQPLAAVVMNGNACRRWLALDPPDLAEAREAAERVVRDGTRAAQVIARVRALLHGGAPEKQPLSLNEVVGEALAFTRGEIDRQGVTLRVALRDGLPMVSGDRVQLQQVLVNVVLNGIEAMAEVPESQRLLEIASQDDGAGGVRVAVSDRGKGLDPASAAQLFEPFFSTKPGGLGLGLAISRSIVEAHGGRIAATPNEGAGATIAITLPGGNGDA
ncbi:PAS domain-containing sensor histidine kinase [Roseisolibacter agri]|uniref:histidine kinase n=1 Tax=Roseisolibacter agri TaxID=2014610 RepID=A0AA37QJH0_9BACT|nr:PAS domain-containing sensor histidine kinase [Roseisolibacter agri]GLC26948.1 hypothetical protein rosag_34610 [Roseisolibacter agri]